MVAQVIQRDADGRFIPGTSGSSPGFMAPRLPPSTPGPRSPPQYADSAFDLPLASSNHVYHQSTMPPRVPPWIRVQPALPPKEKGRWVDLIIAAGILALAIVRAVTALSTADIDVLGAFQALVWCFVAFFVAAPEANRLPCWDLTFATRSSLFDRGLLFVVAGLSNITVEWILLGSQETPAPTTKWPSYCIAAAISVTGIVYIVVHAKDFNRNPQPSAAAAAGGFMPGMPPFGPPMPGTTATSRAPMLEKDYPWMSSPHHAAAARSDKTRSMSLSDASSSKYSTKTGSTSKRYFDDHQESSRRRGAEQPERKKSSRGRRAAPQARSATDTEFGRSTRAPAPSTFVA